MKKQALMISFALTLFVMLAASSVNAQSDMHLTVNIPFEFSVRGKTLPPGEYTVRRVTQGLLLIQSVDRHVSQTFGTVFTKASKRRDQSSLVFNRYGDQYFLSTIWRAGDDTGQELKKSYAEEQLIRANRLLAGSASERQTLSIVAHR